MSSSSGFWNHHVQSIARSILSGSSVVALASCGGTDAVGTKDLLPCTGPVAISVSTGTTPTISWTPACKVYYLDIEVADTFEEIWAVANFDEKNTISPGVKFGVTPSDTRLIEGPVTLRAGTAYSVFVAFYHNGVETDGGRLRFTP